MDFGSEGIMSCHCSFVDIILFDECVRKGNLLSIVCFGVVVKGRTKDKLSRNHQHTTKEREGGEDVVVVNGSLQCIIRFLNGGCRHS